MAPPAWAYHVDNFDPPPDEELVCSVCRGVFCDPVQSPCNHVFCRNCLTKWLETSRTCPICRKRTTRSSVQEVVPLIRNMILKLSLHCRNSENGCSERFSLEGCESHMKVCTYEMVRCKNRPCVMMFMRKDIKEHELKGCPHRYVRCKTCHLKVSSRESSSHDCIKALKRKLKMRDEDLRRKSKKIKELQDEIKILKEAERESSDQSSLGSVSAADIMIDLFPSFPSSTAGSSITGDSNSYVSDSEDEAVDWFDDFLDSSEISNNPLPELTSSDHNDDSIEYPRASVPEPPEEISLPALDTSGSTSHDEPLVRRPAKRRHALQIFYSSDEENYNDYERSSLPSPKRSWVMRNDAASQNDSSREPDMGNSDNAAGPSHSTPTHAAEESVRSIFRAGGATRSANSDGASSNSKLPFKLRPRLKKQPNKGQTLPAIANPIALNGSPVFERTIAMLEQYNLESDPEWLPSADRAYRMDSSSDSEASICNGIPFMDGHITSSYESSHADSASSTSSDDAAGTHNLFFSLKSDSSDDDPDWNPH